MSAAGDISPTRSSGLSHVLSMSSRRKKGADSNSMISNSSDGHQSSFRSSIGSAIDKLKSHDKGESEDEEEHTGLAKLMPKKIISKRRRKKEEQESEQQDREEAARGRHVAERGTLENDSGRSNLSADGTGDAEGDGSSLITYESETESVHDVPPPLATHPSHIGYLTTSSPLVHASTFPEVATTDTEQNSVDRSSTFPTAPSNASTPTLATNLQAPEEKSSKRSPSPAGRLKEAFSPRRGSSPKTSPERKIGLGIGGSLKEKNLANNRRGSVASRLGSIFPEKQGPPAVVSDQSSPDRSRNGKSLYKIDTNSRPNTPPAGENQAPVIVNTPPTPTESSISRFSSPEPPKLESPTTKSNPNVVTSASGNMISHRRIRSGSSSLTLGPSKLSNITSAPLTPTPENGSTTPVTNPAGSFFSSVFSAAQNAANTLSNSIANTTLANTQAKNKSGTQDLKIAEDVEVEVESAGRKVEGEATEEKELAVKTLGMGDLSLSHLGITDSNSGGNTPISSRFPDGQEPRGRSATIVQDESQNGYAPQDGDDSDPLSTIHVDDVQSIARPRSVYEPSMPGDQTPPNGSVYDGKSGVVRSGSMRSAMENRRKRGSSVATGTTIAAAIAAANASVARPNDQGSTPKLTGFAVASKKRNRDFHQLFRSVPDDDYLIEDYSCALQREILAHGRLYVSEGHLCFSSNIFGWVTTLVMSFDEIVSVEKRSTALLFKNGLMISTLHAKNVFASFTSRDSTYDLIVGIWKLGHPSLRSSLNGVRIDETGGGDKTEKDDGQSQSGSDSEEESEDGDDIYDEDDEDEDGLSYTQAEGSIAGSDTADKTLTRKASAVVNANGGVSEKSKEGSPTSAFGEFPGPAAHAPTECTDLETHYEKILADELIPAPLGKVYNMMFGPASVVWMANWLTNDLKCLDLQTDDKKGLTNDNKVRVITYIKPLSGSIGPRQTKCIVTETLDSLDLERAVSITSSTQTPDVPSGNVFTTKTKFCLSWGEGNTTRLQMNCAIEWTGKSWLKGPIEKGANDGQVQYAKDIIAAIKAATTSRPRAGTSGSGPKSKKKGRRGALKSSSGKGIDGASDSKTSAKKDDWGLLEPLHSLLGPLIDIFKPLISGNMVYGLLVGLLVAAWFSFGYGRAGGNERGMGFFSTPERIAAYEEMWRREESDLWDWLEERVGMERLHPIYGRAEEGKTMEDRVREERVSDREIEVAIKITEEKLGSLKEVMGKKKAAMAAGSSEQYQPLVDLS